MLKQPVLGKDYHEYNRDHNPGLIHEGIGPFRAGRKEPGEFSRDDMPAVSLPAGTLCTEGINDDKGRKEYPDEVYCRPDNRRLDDSKGAVMTAASIIRRDKIPCIWRFMVIVSVFSLSDLILMLG